MSKLEKVKYLIVGIVVGATLGSTIAWAAATRVLLISPDERPLGTADNPLYIIG